MPGERHDDGGPCRAGAGRFAACAREAGVPFDGYHDRCGAYRAIIEAAEARGCDMIVMVTHAGRLRDSFRLADKAVLAGSKLPLLSCTDATEPRPLRRSAGRTAPDSPRRGQPGPAFARGDRLAHCAALPAADARLAHRQPVARIERDDDASATARAPAECGSR